jgi:lipopolysaccharide transport system ATP-binding protein
MSDAVMPAAMAMKADGLTKAYRLYDSLTEQVLDVAGLSRLRFWRQGRRRTFEALKSIDLEVWRGERLGIIGRNGAGKTTFLKLLTGATQPTSGTIEIDGSVQALMQVGLGFHPDFTGEQNIRSSLVYNGLTSDETEDAVQDIIEFVELGEFLHQPFKTYSLGMRARLQFATATAIQPDILVIDEVLGAGDAYFSAKSAIRMKHLTERSNSTLFLVSHSMSQVMQFCDRVIWLHEGGVRMDGDSRTVVGEYEAYTQKLSERLTPESSDETESFRLAKTSPGDMSAGSFASTLDDGQKVYRWAADTGAKLAEFAITADGRPADRFQRDQNASFNLAVKKEVDRPITVRHFVTIFRLDGTRVTRLESPSQTLHGPAGTVNRAEVALAPCRLGAGQYFVNYLMTAGDNGDTLLSGRYDLASKFGDFEIVRLLDYTEEPLFYHQADWTFPDLAGDDHVDKAS